MLDPTIRRLLDEAINTSAKLAIVMLYAGENSLCSTARVISKRLWANLWDVAPALEEMVRDGVLTVKDGEYRLDPVPERQDGLRQLLAAYDEPVHRQEIMRLVAELDSYAPYREMLKARTVVVF